MTITTTDFEHNFHGHVIHSSRNGGDYVRHEVDIYNTVCCLDAVYQNGLSYLGNDYDRPDPRLQLSPDGGADERLVTVDQLTESELDALKDSEDLAEFLEEVSLDGIDSWESLAALFGELRDNEHAANIYLRNLEFSDDVDDYVRDEEEYFATLKVSA